MLRTRCLAVRGALASYTDPLQLTEAAADVARAALAYIYSDHAPIEELGARGIELIEQAARLGLRRLVELCELYATKARAAPALLRPSG